MTLRRFTRAIMFFAVPLILVGLFYAAFAVISGLAKKPSATPATNAVIAAQSTSASTPSATFAPTSTPWPTVDTRYLAPHQTEVALAALSAQAAQVQVNAYSQKVEIDLKVSNATETREAINFATQAAIATAHHNAGLTATPKAQAFANFEAARVARQRERDRADLFTGAALVLGCIVIVAAVVVVSNGIMVRQSVAAHRAIAALAANIDPAAEVDNAPAPTATLINQSDDPQVYSAKRIPPPPGKPDKIAFWARAVLEGESVGVDQWEQAGSPFPGSREYRHGVYQWVITNDLTEYSDRKRVLNALGRKIVQAWLDSHAEAENG